MRAYLLVLLLFIPNLAHTQDSLQLNRLFESIANYEDSVSLNKALWDGKHLDTILPARWDDMLQHKTQYASYVQALRAIPDDSLSRQQQISKAVMLLKLGDVIGQITYHIPMIPFNAEGGFFNQATFFLPSLPFRHAEDYRDYLRWLPSYADYLTSQELMMERGMDEGVMAPKVIGSNMLAALVSWGRKDWRAHPFAQPLLHLPSNISAADSITLVTQGKAIIENKIIPAYLELSRFLLEEYIPAAPEAIGVSHITNGHAYYEDRVRFYTTLDITPDSVYQTGLREVKRIREKMEGIIEELGYEGSFQDFITFLRTDEQFYPETPDELLHFAAWLSKKAEGQLPKLFAHLNELPYTVEPVPDDIAPTYTAGRYVEGNWSKNKPGIYWVNTYNLPSRSLYNLPALTLHEAVPGHHLQHEIAKRQEGLPDFRQSYYISAFGEGWGLYSEFLGEEMGLYTTPYEWFGRYTYEMWRAVRLVVDVGMHYKGWTRQQAVDYMAENTALSLHEVNTEIDRYIGWPGQALSYKMGEITIRNLREQAEQELGDRFDIKAFHDVVLRNGSVPLPVLIEEVEGYIEGNR